jgi:hypothetical protein
MSYFNHLFTYEFSLFISARVSVRLLNREEGLSVCVITFADDLSTPYIAIGTAIIYEDEDTPKYGRIILYRYKNGHLNMITEKELNAAPHAMLAFQNKLLVAVGSSVRRKETVEFFM